MPSRICDHYLPVDFGTVAGRRIAVAARDALADSSSARQPSLSSAAWFSRMLAIEVRWATAFLVDRVSLPRFPQCHLVGERLTKTGSLRKSLMHGGDRSPSCGTSAPAGVPLGEGDSPSRS